MNDLIQGALEKAQQKLMVQEGAQREELALYFDLYTREYSPDGALTEEYCYYDGEEESKRYFRKVAMPLSDEEAARLADMRAKLEATHQKRKPRSMTPRCAANPSSGRSCTSLGSSACS